MRIVVISGSTRPDGLNGRLARLVAEARPDATVQQVTWLASLPFYDAGLEAAGPPAAVADLRRVVAEADLVVVVTPEYNRTVPGVLVNAIDWLSRPHRGSVLLGKDVALLAATPSAGGARAALDHLRQVLTFIGARVRERELGLPDAPHALTDRRRVLAAVHEVVSPSYDAVA